MRKEEEGRGGNKMMRLPDRGKTHKTNFSCPAHLLKLIVSRFQDFFSGPCALVGVSRQFKIVQPFANCFVVPILERNIFGGIGGLYNFL